jgi:hypothetical protein
MFFFSQNKTIINILDVPSTEMIEDMKGTLFVLLAVTLIGAHYFQSQITKPFIYK